jgi:inner membrane protein
MRSKSRQGLRRNPGYENNRQLYRRIDLMDETKKTVGKNMLSKLGNPVTLKIVAIGILTLLLLKPASMIESLIQERETRQKEVVAEIGSKWGREQTIMGPVISIPYITKDDHVSYVHILPENLKIKGKILPEVRYRGIFEAVLYKAQLELTGSFPYPRIEELNVPRNDMQWSGAVISVGISDILGIKKQIVANINEDPIAMNPGLATNDVVSSGVSAPIVLDPQTKEYAFKIAVNLNGSDRIDFVPVGKSTTVSLSSDWPNPSFGGTYLPSKRTMTKENFAAKWEVFDLNREYPQHWHGDEYRKQAEGSVFGVGLYTPVDFYQKSMRATKYAILFVVLTFSAFFISELLASVRLHPVQYLLIGLAIITFYTLLLSLSEHTNFRTSYALSSAAVVILVTAYAKSILKKRRLAGIVGGVLAIVYTYSYWLLQMVDYALVVGSIGLFVVLAVIMYVTRKIDWYSIKVPSGPEALPRNGIRDEELELDLKI